MYLPTKIFITFSLLQVLHAVATENETTAKNKITNLYSSKGALIKRAEILHLRGCRVVKSFDDIHVIG